MNKPYNIGYCEYCKNDYCRNCSDACDPKEFCSQECENESAAENYKPSPEDALQGQEDWDEARQNQLKEHKDAAD